MLRPFAVLLLAVFAEGYKAPNIIMMIADGTFTATSSVPSFTRELLFGYELCIAGIYMVHSHCSCCMRAHNLSIHVYPTANLCGTRYHDGARISPAMVSFNCHTFLSVALF